MARWPVDLESLRIVALLDWRLVRGHFICTAILAIPRFGAATVLALIVVGQKLGSLTFDQFGFDNTTRIH